MAEANVWLLLGRKAGDNTQVRALAAELGWPCEEKHLVAHFWELLTHLLPGSTLAGIKSQQSSPLAAPWPDLVISAGRRNEPVARWIRQRSGGVTKLVHLGRPWAAPKNYDLVITTPQYFLPAAENIHCNNLPLHRLDKTELTAAGQVLAKLLGEQSGALPRPYLVMLVGGNSGRFVFTERKARQLAQRAQQLLELSGGSLLLTNSARTPATAWRALTGELRVPHYAHDASASPGYNPYVGMLALADKFVVTGESMSMLGEASAMGKPLYIFDMNDLPGPWWRHPHNYRYKSLSHHLAMSVAPRRMRRDVSRIQQAMIQQGMAAWLGQQLQSMPDSAQRQEDELPVTAQRVRALFTA